MAERLYQELCTLLGEFSIGILMKNKMFTYVTYLNKHILRGAMGEISNFYNCPPRMLIFGTLMPPAVTMHAAKFHACLPDTL